MDKKLEDIVTKSVAPDMQRFSGNSLDQFHKSGGVYSYYTTKITDKHLKSTSQVVADLAKKRI